MSAKRQRIPSARRLQVPSAFRLNARSFDPWHPTALDWHIASSPSILRHSVTPSQRHGNINPLSIGYAFRPDLRIRLTPGGRTFPGKPWSYGDRNFHPVFRYSCLHGHLYEVHGHLHFRFAPHTTLFYHVRCRTSASSVSSLVPIIFGAKSLDQCAITRSLNDGCL